MSGPPSARAQAAPVSTVAPWACSADADTTLLAGFLTFKEGRNFKTKKTLQRESSTFQSSGMDLLDSSGSVRCREWQGGHQQWDGSARHHSQLQGPQISCIKQWAKQLGGQYVGKRCPSESCTEIPCGHHQTSKGGTLWRSLLLFYIFFGTCQDAGTEKREGELLR